MHALRLVSDANKVQPSWSYASTPSAIRLSQSLLASLMYASRLRHPHSHIRSCTHLPPLHQIAAEMRAEPRFRASVSGEVDPRTLFR